MCIYDKKKYVMYFYRPFIIGHLSQRNENIGSHKNCTHRFIAPLFEIDKNNGNSADVLQRMNG